MAALLGWGEPKVGESTAAHADAAHILLNAWVTDVPISDRAEYPKVGSLSDVYNIHKASAADPLAEKLGGVVGYKQGGIGAVPDTDAVYGLLFGCGLVETPAGLSASKFGLFGVEAEIAFVLGATDLPIDKAPWTEAQIWAATREIFPCIELCGRRHTLKDAANLDNLADWSCTGGVVCGKRYPASDVAVESLNAIETKMIVGGVEKSAGSGVKCPLGGPLASITWCINHLAARGIAIEPGNIIISGATCKTRDFQPGELIEAQFSSLENVSTTLAV